MSYRSIFGIKKGADAPKALVLSQRSPHVRFRAFQMILSGKSRLDVASWVTFSFWVIVTRPSSQRKCKLWPEDVPLHLIFGVQLEGTLELRPRKLWSIYFRCSFQAVFICFCWSLRDLGIFELS